MKVSWWRAATPSGAVLTSFRDILMPRLDGYQACAILQRGVRHARHTRQAHAPVVMPSSGGGVFDKASGRMVGCQEYLIQAFAKDQLPQAVRHFGVISQGAM